MAMRMSAQELIWPKLLKPTSAIFRRFAVNYVGLGELAKARASADRVTFAARTAQAKARRPSRRQGPACALVP